MRAPTRTYRGERGRIMLLKRYIEARGGKMLPQGGGYRSGDGLTDVSWSPGELVVEVRERPAGLSRTSTVAVGSVKQAIDVLTALDVLPLTFSSAYQLGREDQAASFAGRIRRAT